MRYWGIHSGNISWASFQRHNFIREKTSFQHQKSFHAPTKAFNSKSSLVIFLTLFWVWQWVQIHQKIKQTFHFILNMLWNNTQAINICFLWRRSYFTCKPLSAVWKALPHDISSAEQRKWTKIKWIEKRQRRIKGKSFWFSKHIIILNDNL